MMKTIRFTMLSAAATLLTVVSSAFAAPATLTQSVTYNGETITMQLTKENIRGANFEFKAQNSTGTYDTITPVAERSYIGTVDEYPAAVSYGILQDDGAFKGGVIFDRGDCWYIVNNGVTSTSTVAQPTSFGYSSWTVNPGQAGSKVYGFDVGIDARYEYFNERGGGSLDKTLEVIEFSLTQNRALYIHDAMLRPFLARVIVRTDPTQDPAAGLTGGTYLDAVKNEWNNNQTDADRDVVAGISTSHVWAGLAWVNAIAGGNGYSVNDSQGDGNFNKVWQHELGHNWGLSHYDGGAPEKGTINSNNHFARMSGPEVHKVLNQRNAKLWALDDLGPLTTVNIPPYASYDSSVFTQGVDSQLTIDVLANDHDANAHTLTLTSVQSTTAQGGTASVQGGVVVYTPHGNFIGVDSFTYTVQDSSGQTATGAVAIDVQRGDRLRLYVDLDETTGTTAEDNSPFNDNGTLSGTDFDTSSVAGKFGNAVNLDGVDDHLTTSWVSLNSNTVTLAAWIKPGATSNPWSGIIFDRNYGATGLNFGNNGELRYHWNDSQWGWNSGLTPAANTWTFVALVVEPSKATIYMNDGSGFQSAVNNVSHTAAAFGNVSIGHDPAQAARHFLGAIDEARIYNEALSSAELQKLFDGGSAEAPTPFDGASEVGPSDLAWAPSAVAVQYHVYLGTDATAVQNATTASAEYQGAVTAPTLTNPATTALATNYWRVDTETAAGTITGSVWSFARNEFSAVPIANNSFEVGSGNGAPANWTLTAGSSSSLGVAAGGSNGSQFLWIGPGVEITQDLTHTLKDGEELTLKYDSSRSHVRTVQLLAKSGGSYQLMAETTETIGWSSWGTATLNHTVAPQYLGQQLAIRVISGNWNEFDNFRITTVGGTSNHAPVFTADPVSANNAHEAAAYSDSIAASATDADAGDTISYSKLSGPAWLTVASDGSLSGTPATSDVGANSFTVQADDGNGGTITATLNITVKAFVGTLMSDNFERAAGSTLGGGWIEQSNDSRIYDTSQPATKMLISVSAGTPFAVVNQLSNTFVAGERYELAWNGSRAASANGTLNYDVSIGTWNGTTFTPLASQNGSIANVNLFGKVAGPSATVTASATEAGQQIAVRLEVLSGSSHWAGFDDIAVNALGTDTSSSSMRMSTNQAPAFHADPLVKADASEGSAYSGNIAGDASDPDGDALTFSKVNGPAWLTVANDGTLSGTPAASDVGVNQWSVTATDSGSLSASTTLRITVAAAPSSSVSYAPTGQTTTYGIVTAGSANEVLTSDNSYQLLQEESTSGKPTTRVSRMQHTVSFDIGNGGSAVALEVEAHHDANSEGDDFIFSWSSDGTNFTDVITVTKTTDDDQVQSATLPANLTGQVWIRVRDADRSAGNYSLEQIHIDRLNLVVTP